MRSPGVTVHAERLRALAAEVARTLPPSLAVAITGSAARGDASAGSDLDLWVVGGRAQPLGDRCFHGELRVVGGVSVTLLRQSRAQALTPDSLHHFEVEDALVVREVAGTFAAIRRKARRTSVSRRRSVVEATRATLLHELATAKGVRGLPALSALRTASFRVAALWLYLRRGWRVPKLRTLEAHLPREAWATLTRQLGLPAGPGLRGTVQRWAALRRRARGSARSLLPQVPSDVGARVAAQEWADGWWLWRRFLELEVVPSLESRGAATVRAPVLHAWRRAHRPASFDAAVDALVDLVDALGAWRALGGPVGQALRRLQFRDLR
ncbi:MAG: nucleotidyltransferase domain-containing protein [Myxococcaceae bacterium]|nr:nucleotidyltransferase domain-containing protein [Myxococcaceae bacterium]